MAKRILMITCSIESPNGICVQAILEEARKREIQVDCVCSGDELPQDDLVRFYPVRRRWMDRFYFAGKPSNTMLFRLSLLVSRCCAVAMAGIWPFMAPLYYHRLKKQALALADAHSYDAVVATYNLYECLMAARKVKEKHPQIKLAAYFLDSLSGGRNPRYLTPATSQKKGLRAERRILRQADRVIIMKAHEAFYQKLWQHEVWRDKVTVLDVPLLSHVDPQPAPVGQGGPFQMVYAGALQLDLKSPAYFLQLLSQQDFSDLAVTFIGPSNCQAMTQAAQKASRAQIVQKPPVPHSEAVAQMRKADVLLNIGSMNNRQIPCKIFEYMAAGKPIVATASSSEEPSVKYLRQYPAALILLETDPPADNAARLRQFLNQLPGQRVDTSALEKRFYICTPRAFVDAIEQ